MRFVFFLAFILSKSEALSYYVSVGGNDQNSGTIDSAFATIQHALNHCEPGDTVYVRGGNYEQTINLSGISGAENALISIKNYEDETVVIDGTRGIAPVWTLDEGHVYKAVVPDDVTQLFVDGDLMVLARYPNVTSAFDEDYWNPRIAQDAGSANGALIDSHLTTLPYSFNGCVAVMTQGAHVTYARLVQDHLAGSNTFGRF